MADQDHEALAQRIPDEWVEAANARYSMHGAGLVRNILAGAIPLIAADVAAAVLSPPPVPPGVRERLKAVEAKRKEIEELCWDIACGTPKGELGRVPVGTILALIGTEEDGDG